MTHRNLCIMDEVGPMNVCDLKAQRVLWMGGQQIKEFGVDISVPSPDRTYTPVMDSKGNVVEKKTESSMAAASYPSINAADEKTRHRDWSREHGNDRFTMTEKMDAANGVARAIVGPDQTRTLDYKNKSSSKAVTPFDTIFGKAMSSFLSKLDQLNPNYSYGHEAFSRRRSNVVRYNRLPRYHLVMFDIKDHQTDCYLDMPEVIVECERLGFEYAPVLFDYRNPPKRFLTATGEILNPVDIAEAILADMDAGKIGSLLGADSGSEGLVLKHPRFFSRGKYSATKIKFVRSAFKERHALKGKKADDVPLTLEFVVKELAESLCTRARLNKIKQAIRHEISSASHATMRPKDEFLPYFMPVHELERMYVQDLLKEETKYLRSAILLEVRPFLIGKAEPSESSDPADCVHMVRTLRQFIRRIKEVDKCDPLSQSTASLEIILDRLWLVFLPHILARIRAWLLSLPGKDFVISLE